MTTHYNLRIETRTDVAKLVTNNKEGRGFSMVAFSNYATRSIPIAVTKDGTKELNMCVLVVHCNSSYNNNQ